MLIEALEANKGRESDVEALRVLAVPVIVLCEAVRRLVKARASTGHDSAFRGLRVVIEAVRRLSEAQEPHLRP